MTEALNRHKFDALIARLKDSKFDFSKSQPRYNPIEIFLNQVSRKENAHSDLLADLFNPNGKHGKGELFLRSFFSGCGFDRQDIEWNNISVVREYGVYNSGHSRRRIDILIRGKYTDARQFAVIIENKINGAPYLPGQIEDYCEGIEKELENGDVRVVCIHPDCNNQCSDSEVIITPHILGNIIDDGLKNCDEQMQMTLGSYSNYLQNLGIMGQSIDNAKKLLDLSYTAADLKMIQAINAAYSALPQAYAELFLDYLNQYPDGIFKKYKTEYLKNYPGYCLIWNEESYKKRQTWQFMAIGFYHDRVKFYMVSNDWTDEESIKKAKELGFSEDFSKSCGWRWFQHNVYENEIAFKDDENEPLRPDFEKIAAQTKAYLDLLDQAE